MSNDEAEGLRARKALGDGMDASDEAIVAWILTCPDMLELISHLLLFCQVNRRYYAVHLVSSCGYTAKSC